MNLPKSLFLLICGALFLNSCSGKSKTPDAINEDTLSDIAEVSSHINTDNLSDLKPEEMMFLVEGAVDSWFFYNLDNYDSYKPILRKTDYDSIRNLHIHHVRYKTMNKEGGFETTEKLLKSHSR